MGYRRTGGILPGTRICEAVRGLVKQLEILREFDPAAAPAESVGLGSLVLTETGDFTDWIFVLPCCGGMEIKIDETEVNVITPESPLAIRLLQKTPGSAYLTPAGTQGRIVKVF